MHTERTLKLSHVLVGKVDKSLACAQKAHQMHSSMYTLVLKSTGTGLCSRSLERAPKCSRPPTRAQPLTIASVHCEPSEGIAGTAMSAHRLATHARSSSAVTETSCPQLRPSDSLQTLLQSMSALMQSTVLGSNEVAKDTLHKAAHTHEC